MANTHVDMTFVIVGGPAAPPPASRAQGKKVSVRNMHNTGPVLCVLLYVDALEN